MRISSLAAKIILVSACGLSGLCPAGCGADAGWLNPAFVNTFTGGIVPLTPGPSTAAILVRCVNETDETVEFIITIERLELVADDQGNPQYDEDAEEWVTRPTRQTVRLATSPGGLASDMGILFSCQESPVTHIGLGEDLLPTDAAILVGGTAGGATGVGVKVGDLNPLQLAANNFDCGDTVIFRAFRSTSVVGGVALQSFLLPGSEQPSAFSGPSTFRNWEQFLESQVREEEP